MTGILLAILAAVLNSLWQAALAAALVWAALKLLARAGVAVNAATRYVIWWVVLAVVLALPAGPQVKAELWPAHAQPSSTAADPLGAPRVLTPLVMEPPAPVLLPAPKSAQWPWWIFGLGAAALVYRLDQIARSYFYLRGLKQRAAISAQPMPSTTRPVRLLLSREATSPMAVGFLHPAVVLPDSLIAELSAPELEHVLMHEVAHIARRDDWTNLAARLLGGALALHPVAWWILRQIEREREIACDDWVVARTGSLPGNARAYAESLARLSELRWAKKGPLPGNALASGIFGGGSRVVERIELLLGRGRKFSGRASRARVAIIAAVLLGFAIAGSFAPRWIAFAQTRPAFEVASVRAVKPGTHAEPSFETSPDSLTVRGTNLTGLLMWAYQIRDADEISGPDWRYTQAFDITAKSAGPVATDQLRLMLQSLLEERLKLVVHQERKIAPLYSLVVGKDGVKLHEVQQEPRQGGRIGLDHGAFRFEMINRISALTSWLPAFLDNRPVVDNTGLPGVYEIAISVELDEGQQRQMPQPGLLFRGFGFAPAVFDAVERMGLKLESTKGPVDYLIIDHAEKPGEN